MQIVSNLGKRMAGGRVPPQMAQQSLEGLRNQIELPSGTAPDLPTQVGQQLPTVQAAPPNAGNVTELRKVFDRDAVTASAKTQAMAGMHNGQVLGADTAGAVAAAPPATDGERFASQVVERMMPPETVQRALRASQFFQGMGAA